ncbi:MAG: IspD/TarI family cytidylyltransferase [bacterium JZ-2024 1]
MRARADRRPSHRDPAPPVKADAVLLAAGSGSRFGSPRKLIRAGRGPSVLAACLKFWDCVPSVSTIVVTLPRDRQREKTIREHLSGLNKKVLAVYGGETRQASVYSALSRVRASYVLIHDVARPTLYAEDVDSLIQALRNYDAVSLGCPARDTLVHAPGGIFSEIIPRDSVWALFTPQGFRSEVLRKAHQWAQSTDAQFTDDFTLASLFTSRTYIVETHKFYLKVTYPEDRPIWEKLQERSE